MRKHTYSKVKRTQLTEQLNRAASHAEQRNRQAMEEALAELMRDLAQHVVDMRNHCNR